MTEEKINTSDVTSQNSDITTFKKSVEGMVVKSDRSWNEKNHFFSRLNKTKDYSREEIERIIDSGSLVEQQRLSKNYFLKDGIYKRIIIHYATLLKYVGILIPNPIGGNELSKPHILKKYNNGLDYVEKFFTPELMTKISKSALVEGCYYGVIQEVSKQNFVLLDLPSEYCRSNFKDFHGNDIVEFNVCYFDSIIEDDVRKEALKVYPKVIADHYRRYTKAQVSSMWVKIPTDIGFCFSFFDDCRPLFLDTIPAAIEYDDAVDLDHERDLEEIRKIIVQHIPHLTADGTLVFEPQEAEVMHEGAVNMMKGNKNISVLTTYADVEAIVSKTSSEAVTNTLEKNLQNVYSRANASQQLFAPTGSQALSTSITNDMALMMILANKYSRFITYILNTLFSNSNVFFKYEFLPVTWYNAADYIKSTLNLAQNGYSLLLPSIAAGVSQRDLVSLKALENDSLNLTSLLIPLSTAFNGSKSSEDVGRPKKSLDEKAPKTLQNEEALNNQ